MVRKYKKPRPLGDRGLEGFNLNDAYVRIMDTQYRYYNEIVDREGWKQAHITIATHMAALVNWLHEAYGDHTAYAVVTRFGDGIINISNNQKEWEKALKKRSQSDED